MIPYDGKPDLEISSPANPRVKWLLSLRKRRTRDAEGMTRLEGYDELLLALDAGAAPRTLFHCPALAGQPDADATLERVAASGSEMVRLSAATFAKVSYREGPDGWLAVVADPALPLDQITLSSLPLVLVCQGVEKPGNLGAMLRTADAAGVDAVVAADPATDWGNPNVVRASKGTVFAVPIASASSELVRTWLSTHGLQVVSATPDTDRLITDVDLTTPTAIVVGAEHEGLSESWADTADIAAKLPMAGRVNSLNVATSAAIALYEAVRQRANV